MDSEHAMSKMINAAVGAVLVFGIAYVGWKFLGGLLRAMADNLFNFGGR